MFARISGAGNGCANFMGSWNYLPIKFLVLGRVFLVLGGGGGGSADFIFMGQPDAATSLAA